MITHQEPSFSSSPSMNSNMGAWRVPLALMAALSTINVGQAQMACNLMPPATCPNGRCRVTNHPLFGPLCVDQSGAPTRAPTQTACANIAPNNCPDRCTIVQHGVFGALCLNPADAPTTGAPTTGAPTTRAPATQAPATRAPVTLAPMTAAPTTATPTDRTSSSSAGGNSGGTSTSNGGSSSAGGGSDTGGGSGSDGGSMATSGGAGTATLMPFWTISHACLGPLRNGKRVPQISGLGGWPWRSSQVLGAGGSTGARQGHMNAIDHAVWGLAPKYALRPQRAHSSPPPLSQHNAFADWWLPHGDAVPGSRLQAVVALTAAPAAEEELRAPVGTRAAAARSPAVVDPILVAAEAAAPGVARSPAVVDPTRAAAARSPAAADLTLAAAEAAAPGVARSPAVVDPTLVAAARSPAAVGLTLAAAAAAAAAMAAQWRPAAVLVRHLRGHVSRACSRHFAARTCPPQRPWSSDAYWCLQSDAAPDTHLQVVEALIAALAVATLPAAVRTVVAVVAALAPAVPKAPAGTRAAAVPAAPGGARSLVVVQAAAVGLPVMARVHRQLHFRPPRRRPQRRRRLQHRLPRPLQCCRRWLRRQHRRYRVTTTLSGVARTTASKTRSVTGASRPT